MYCKFRKVHRKTPLPVPGLFFCELFIFSAFLQNTSGQLLLKFVEYLFLEYLFIYLGKSILLHRIGSMLKFSEILILVCRKIFFAFSNETFSNSFGFLLMYKFSIFSPHLVFYDRQHFCSILTDLSNL